MDALQISHEDQERVFKLVASILWLGNISFEVIDHENHVQVVTDEGIFLNIHLILFNNNTLIIYENNLCFIS